MRGASERGREGGEVRLLGIQLAGEAVRSDVATPLAVLLHPPVSASLAPAAGLGKARCPASRRLGLPRPTSLLVGRAPSNRSCGGVRTYACAPRCFSLGYEGPVLELLSLSWALLVEMAPCSSLFGCYFWGEVLKVLWLKSEV